MGGLFTTDAASAVTAVASPHARAGDACFAADNIGPSATGTQLGFPLPDGQDRRIRAVRAVARPAISMESQSVGSTLTFVAWRQLHLQMELRSSRVGTNTQAQLTAASNISPAMIGQRFTVGEGWTHVDWLIPPADVFLYAVCRTRAGFIGGQLYNVAANQNLVEGVAGVMDVFVQALVDVPV